MLIIVFAIVSFGVAACGQASDGRSAGTSSDKKIPLRGTPMEPSPTGACSARDGRPPENATDVSSTKADIDGEGTKETIYFYRQPSGKQQENLDEPGTYLDPDERWFVRAEVENGTAWGSMSFGRPMAIGSTDVDVNGRDEVWYDPQTGNTGHSVAAVVLDGCRLVELHDVDGDPTGFLRGLSGQSSIGVIAGTQCVDLDGDGRQELVETTYDQGKQLDPRRGVVFQAEPETWAYTAFSLSGAMVTKSSEMQPTRTKPGASLTFSAGFNCGDIRYMH